MIENCAALTIAGSDSGGGAGIQADLKTFSALKVFGTSVITAVTAQNLSGIYDIQPIDTEVVQKQLMAVLDGFPIKAIKTGMLFSAPIIDTIAETLAPYRNIPLVIDPVFSATSGSQLIRDEAIETLKEKLFPLAALLTPNMPEAEILTGTPLNHQGHLEKAGRTLFQRFEVPVLMKGGHLSDKEGAVDVLVDAEGTLVFNEKLVHGVNNHGSGCTLASAITAALARGQSLREAVKTAKDYITHALNDSFQLEPGIHVINHLAVTSGSF